MKQSNKQSQATNLIEDDSLSDSRPSSPDPIRTGKRRAPEDITNIAKRRRAPRASQLSVAQVSEEFGPKYRSRQRGGVAEASRADGKENEPTRSL